jgi:hypothetical protein
MKQLTRKRLGLIVAACVATILASATGSAHAQAFNLESLLMPGPVIAQHADIEQSCSNCHAGAGAGAESQDVLCGACHTEVLADRNEGHGFHGRDGTAARESCADCHEEHEGRDAMAVQFDPATFDHGLADFALRGAHASLECSGCHVQDSAYRETSNQCVGCHENDDAHMGALGETCSNCHDADGWSEVRFDHRATGFPLVGAHTTAECSSCHESQSFEGASSSCIACHASDDVHATRFGADCGQCHSFTAWTLSAFDHSGESNFPLLGAHNALSCESCHTTDLTTALPRDCQGCHADDDAHGGSLGQNCASCHVVSSWGNSSFDHSTVTTFELLGSHAALACTQCHSSNVTTALPTDCLGCHAPDPHAGQLGEDCADCHAQVSWTEDLLFDHGLSAFPLIGAHATLDCATCHATPAFHDAAQACVDCHVQDDVHASNFGADCANCHNPVAWQRWTFDHALVAKFQLTGAHTDLACATCHNQPLEAMAASTATCATCHRHDDPHNGTFGTACGACHTTEEF